MARTYSVVIPALNEEKFLPNLLISLAAQTRRDFEVIVVDGSSKDKTVDIARSFAKKLPKLQVIVSKKASLPLQRNLGAKAAQGKWFIFIDADSVVVPHFIERIHAYIQQYHPLIFTTWCRPDSEEPRDANIALLVNMVWEMSIILKRPVSPGPLTAVEKSVFERVSGYDETHAYNEDVDFGMRVHQAHVPMHIIPETLFTMSLRRFRNEGTLKVAQQYIISAFPVLLFKRPMKHMPGYVMGGHLYGKKQQSILKRYEKKLRALLKEIFE